MGWLFGDSPQKQADIVNKQVDQQEKAYNDFLNMIKGKVEGTGYDFFAPKKSTSSGTSTTVQNMDQFARPEILPDYKNMESMFRGVLENRLKRPTALPPGYAERAVAGINQAYAGGDTAARNAAARRGLSGEQALALQTPLQNARSGDIADLLAGLPLKERDLQNEDVQLASALTQAFGTGQRSTGSSTSTTKSNQTTINPANAMEFLSYLGLLKPYERPVVTPQPRQGILGPLLQLGTSFL